MNQTLYDRKFEQFRAEGEDHGTADEWAREAAECQGHESLAGEHMGIAVYCDGSCRS